MKFALNVMYVFDADDGEDALHIARDILGYGHSGRAKVNSLSISEHYEPPTFSSVQEDLRKLDEQKERESYPVPEPTFDDIPL